MDNQKTLEFIESEIKKRIKSFDIKRKSYRKKAGQFTILTASLSASTTFFIGMSQTYDSKLISLVALAISSVMTIVNAWESLNSYRQRWVQNNDTLMKFYELNSDINYAKVSQGDDLSLEKINKFYEEYLDILRTANRGWKEDRLAE